MSLKTGAKQRQYKVQGLPLFVSVLFLTKAAHAITFFFFHRCALPSLIHALLPSSAFSFLVLQTNSATFWHPISLHVLFSSPHCPRTCSLVLSWKARPPQKSSFLLFRELRGRNYSSDRSTEREKGRERNVSAFTCSVLPFLCLLLLIKCRGFASPF